MSKTVHLDWEFKPPSYFEEPVALSRHDYKMTIEDGHVRAEIDADIFESLPDFSERLHDSLTDRFLAIELFTHRPYELSSPRRTIVHPDGRKEIFLEVSECVMAHSSASVDLQVIDKDGNVVADTRQTRIDAQNRLIERISVHRKTDRLLSTLLASHAAALRDPDNELVHLYEIRDALCLRFGRDHEARAILGIEKAPWSRFGQLCNDEPLRQGRHRGKAVTLRDATEEELREARKIAQAMINAYLRHLDSATCP